MQENKVLSRNTLYMRVDYGCIMWYT